MTTFKVETSCVLLKSYKHHFESSVITLIFFYDNSMIQVSVARLILCLFTLDTEPGSEGHNPKDQQDKI